MEVEMTDYNTWHFGFVGLGLIGGSLAKAIRRYWPGAVITAYNPSRDSLEEALSDGVIQDGAYGQAVNFDRLFHSCDVIFLCAPVQKNAENLSLIRSCIREDAILSDIGSTKRDIHEHIVAEGLQRHFIAGHPMTGSERTRYRNSRAELLENAYYLLAPEPEVDKAKVADFTALIRSLKAIPLMVTADFHDYAVAGISHVPHVVSASLVNLVKQSDNPDGLMKLIAAGGFRDITRISSSSPEMWEQICLTNGDNIVRLLDDYISILQNAKKQIAEKNGAGIHDLFASAKSYRDSFDVVDTGAANRLWLLHVDIEDRPASLAEVVTLLAVNSVNIKNIGITHNREFQEGALRVEFYTEDDLKEAVDILTTRSYTVYES